jgi:hypothetical protein
MNAVANINSLPSEAYPPLSTSAKQAASGSSTTDSMPVDQVDITPTSQIMQRLNAEDGRVALDTAAGNLTSPLSTELYAQVASIQQQISGAEQHDGGILSSQDAQRINQSESELSASIYSDAHNGASLPSNSTPSAAGHREALQAGRIQMGEQAGNLTTSQAQQLMTQQYQIDGQISTDKAANGGTLTSAETQQVSQLQDQASKQIYQTINGGS